MYSLTFIFIAMNLRFFPLGLHPYTKSFKLGASKDTIATNEANERIARETNQANRDISQQTNEANIQMNQANNDLQRQLQAEMNAYNDIGAQLERGAKAGVNPNAILGGVSGNLQNSLPSTQAGHADVGIPMQPYQVENPYMERLQTLQTLQGAFDSYFKNLGSMAQTELSRSQAIGQNLENKHTDDLRNLQKLLGKKQAEKFDKEIDKLGTERDNMIVQGEQIQASIANMKEDTRMKFLDNQFKEDSRNSFKKYMREYYDKMEIPRNNQLSDDSLDAIYFGALSRYNIPMSELQTQICQRANLRASTAVQGAMRNFYNAKTRGQYIQNTYDTMFGWADRVADLDVKESQANSNNANAKKQKQNYNIDNWQTSEEVQTQRALQVRLDNMQTEANIDNTKMDTFKKGAEGVESITRSSMNVIDKLTPW